MGERRGRRGQVGIRVGCGLLLTVGLMATSLGASTARAGAAAPVNGIHSHVHSGNPSISQANPTLTRPVPPTVTSFVATPSLLTSIGGKVTLSAQVSKGTRCVFSAKPTISGLPSTVACTSGRVSKTAMVPVNTSTKAVTYKFSLSVVGSTTVNAKVVTVTVAAKPPPPTVTSISPISGPLPGTTKVTVKGKNLTGTTAIKFGTASGTHVTRVSSTEVTALSPASTTTGAVNVRVTTPGGTSAIGAGDRFTYVPTPTVTSITPGTGPAAGGTQVTITGTSLSGATSVKFGTKAGTVTADSASSITVKSPAESVGTVNVTVATADGTSAAAPADDFAYTNVVNPCTESITEDSEITAGTYVECPFTVPAGITAAVDPGAIFKFESGDAITVEGTLDANGTATNPVTFTSFNDNSIGGDTGNGSPVAGDWGGITVSGSGSVDLTSTDLDYATTGLSAYTSGNVTVTNSHWAEFVSSGIYVIAGSASIQGNTVTDSGDRAAYGVDSGNLDLSLLSGNSATGGVPDFFLAGTATSGTWKSEPAAWLLGGEECGALDIPVGVTVNIQAGAVIKGNGDSGFNCGSGADEPSITVEGTLDANGTATNPVTFTSFNDNSIGGDTGNGSPVAGDWGGITVSGSGSVDLTSTDLDYATTGLSAYTSGNVTVTNSHWAEFVSSGIYVIAGSASIQGNTVTDSGDRAAYGVDSGNLDLSLLSGNSATGGVPDFFLAGTATSGTWKSEPAAWLLGGEECGALDIPVGVTVNIQAGAVIKGNGDSGFNCGSGADEPSITVEGTLDANGTATNPVTFTSFNDNSIGGDTGNGSPVAGDWGGITVSGSGSVDLTSTDLDYATTGLSAYTSGNVTVTNSHWAEFVSSGIYVIAGSASIQGNTVTDSGDRAAYGVDSGNLDLSLLSGNSATGGVPDFFLAGTATSGTWKSEPAAWLLGGEECGALDIPVGVTVNIQAGAVIKGNGDSGFNCGSGADEPSITVEGTLDANGTATNPVTFTSFNDNSIGGDTGNGSPVAGDWGGITVSGSGSVDLTSTDLDYATTGLSAYTSGNVTVTNSHWAEFVSSGIYVIAGSASIQGNTVTDSGDRAAYGVDSGNLDLSLLSGNSATGGVPDFFLAGTATSGTWKSEPAAWLLGGEECGALDIPVGVTVNIQAGAVIKGNGDSGFNCGSGADEPSITVEGTLDANGTATNPVTFTSFNDNSIGGDTGNGSPVAGDWGGITVSGSGSVDLDNTTIEYASTGVGFTGSGSFDVEDSLIDNTDTGISFSGSSGIITGSINDSSLAIASTSGDLSFRGSLMGDTAGVESCDWGTNCAVDASYSYWGNSNGPGGGVGGSPSVCGAVWVSPSYTSASDTSTANGSPFADNCDGSQTPDEQLASAETTQGQEESVLQYDCEYISQSYCQQVQADDQCMSGLLNAGVAADEYAFTGTADVESNGFDFVEQNASPSIASATEDVGFLSEVEGYASTVVGVAKDLLSCF